MIKIHLLVIDPQMDFVSKNGSLPVPGAEADMDRLALFVKRAGDKLDDIHVTLDSHRIIDISHPEWYRHVSTGKAPDPYTVMVAEGSKIMGYMGSTLVGEYKTTQVSAFTRTIDYLRKLAATNRYPHRIWPEHCLIGDPGAALWPLLSEAIHEWEKNIYGMTDFVTKGSNPWTEHFSAVQAEVPDSKDPSTQVNTALIETLEAADVVLLAGEALSHCLANTVRDIAKNFKNPKYVEKLVLLQDASSNVGGLEKLGDDFVKELVAQGMKLSTTTQFLATA